MPRKTATRRGVLTLTGGALVALAGCSNTGGQEQTATETDAETTTAGDTPTDQMTETETGTEAETPTEEGTEEGTETGGDADAMLRVAHLAPDAPAVDVAVDGETVLSNVTFETVSDYLSVTSGDHQVTVTPTGGSSSVFDQTVTLQPGRQTAAAVGEVSGENQTFTVTLFDDTATTPAAGNTKLRAVHAIPDAPAVDVTASDRTVSNNVAFGEAGNYNNVPSYTRSVAVREESDGNNGDRVATFGVDTTSGAVQTIFLTGYLEPSDQQPDARAVVVTDLSPGESATPTGTATPTETGTATGTETGTGTATGTETGTGTATRTETGTGMTETATDGL